MPRVFGDSSVHISEVDAIIENDSALSTPSRETTALDETISKFIIEMVPVTESSAPPTRADSAECET